MIRALVLAAGGSRRMGMPKPLLRFADTTFLERIVSVLRRSDVDGITVVLGSQAERIRAATDLSGVEVVINENYRDGQLSSLIAGLRNRGGGVPPSNRGQDARAPEEAVLLCLVDNPFITVGVVDAVIGAFRLTQRPIVVPVFQGRRGHPTLFAAEVFDELLNAPASEGARSVVNADRARVFEIEVSDEAILARIDMPEDYVARFGVPPQIREGK